MPEKTPYVKIGEKEFTFRKKIVTKGYKNEMTIPADISKEANGEEVEVTIKIP